MLVDGDSALELEESELFEQEVAMSPSPPVAPALGAVAAEAAAHSEGETDSDDDGIVLESECSSSGGAARCPGDKGWTCAAQGWRVWQLAPCFLLPKELPSSRLLQMPRLMTWTKRLLSG